MSHFIKDLSVRNFKSIRSADLDCARINVFVGKPNVGKSNLLEALSLFCPNKYDITKERFLENVIRYNDRKNLFWNNDINQAIEVKTNLGSVKVHKLEEEENPIELVFTDSHSTVLGDLFFGQHGSIGGRSHSSKKLLPFLTKKYQFKLNSPINEPVGGSLRPPFGPNLFETIDESRQDFKDEIADLFSEYKLELVFDRAERKLELQRKEGRYAIKMDFNLTADTLQRYIFHLAAIESNRDSILLFEEPENHSFPVYIQQLAQRMIDSETNQFFVATHSPYLLNTLVERSKEVAVFVCDFVDYETRFHRLSEEELSDMLNFGIEVFYNLDRYTADVAAQ